MEAQFVSKKKPETIPGQRAAEKSYVLKVYVLPVFRLLVTVRAGNCRQVFCAGFYLAFAVSLGPTEGHLKGEQMIMGFHTEIRTRHADLSISVTQRGAQQRGA